MIENVIVVSDNVLPEDADILFGDESVHYTAARDIPNLLVELGIYASTSIARRSGRVGDIPTGWTESFKASKTRRLWIWNPDEGETVDD